MGPVCFRKHQLETAKNESDENFEIEPSAFKGDIVCERINGRPQTNVPRVITRHSPDGFEWGYGGSGPADLALNIMVMFVGKEKAQKNGLYQEFKWKFIATMPEEGGVIKRDDILAWLDQKGLKQTA